MGQDLQGIGGVEERAVEFIGKQKKKLWIGFFATKVHLRRKLRARAPIMLYPPFMPISLIGKYVSVFWFGGVRIL